MLVTSGHSSTCQEKQLMQAVRKDTPHGIVQLSSSGCRRGHGGLRKWHVSRRPISHVMFQAPCAKSVRRTGPSKYLLVAQASVTNICKISASRVHLLSPHVIVDECLKHRLWVELRVKCVTLESDFSNCSGEQIDICNRHRSSTRSHPAHTETLSFTT